MPTPKHKKGKEYFLLVYVCNKIFQPHQTVCPGLRGGWRDASGLGIISSMAWGIRVSEIQKKANLGQVGEYRGSSLSYPGVSSQPSSNVVSFLSELSSLLSQRKSHRPSPSRVVGTQSTNSLGVATSRVWSCLLCDN